MFLFKEDLQRFFQNQEVPMYFFDLVITLSELAAITVDEQNDYHDFKVRASLGQLSILIVNTLIFYDKNVEELELDFDRYLDNLMLEYFEPKRFRMGAALLRACLELADLEMILKRIKMKKDSIL